MATVVAAESQIVLDEQGVAWLQDTATKVLEVVVHKQATGLTPEALQEEALPHLSLAQIYAALAYYHAHRPEIDAEIERRRRWVEELRAQEPNPLTRAELEARRKQQQRGAS